MFDVVPTRHVHRVALQNLIYTSVDQGKLVYEASCRVERSFHAQLRESRDQQNALAVPRDVSAEFKKEMGRRSRFVRQPPKAKLPKVPRSSGSHLPSLSTVFESTTNPKQKFEGVQKVVALSRNMLTCGEVSFLISSPKACSIPIHPTARASNSELSHPTHVRVPAL